MGEQMITKAESLERIRWLMPGGSCETAFQTLAVPPRDSTDFAPQAGPRPARPPAAAGRGTGPRGGITDALKRI